jgi:hypothetical protein
VGQEGEIMSDDKRSGWFRYHGLHTIKWTASDTVVVLVIWLIWCGFNALLLYEGWPLWE